MNIQVLKPSEYPPYAKTYLNKVSEETEMRSGIEDLMITTLAFLNSISIDKLDYRYESGKWTVKEVIQHIIDTERIFCGRIFRIGRGDLTPIPGFDENDYVLPSAANDKSLEQLISEYKMTRLYHLSIINSLSDKDMDNIGEASGLPVSVRALIFITQGHELHHLDVLRERYL